MTTRATLPSRNALVRDQLVIKSDFNLPTHHRMVEELAAQRAELHAKLELEPSDEPIHVYLFETAERFNEFSEQNYPDFPARRAFFVESDTRLAVYAYWGDRVAEDLRHEVAHGYLHSILPHIPLWLDEGLAEYFEVGRGPAGLNGPHVADLNRALADGSWLPNLDLLERLANAGEMTQLDYAESWAWVHWLLETTPERRGLFHGHLQQLDKGGPLNPLSTAIQAAEPDAELAVVAHVNHLAKAR